MNKKLLSGRKIRRLTLAGKLKNFLDVWKFLTKDTEILELTESYKMPFPNSNMLITLDSASVLSIVDAVCY